MKRSITITGYQRPQLFHQLIQSLAANNLKNWEISVQLEPSEFVGDFRAAAETLSGVPISFTINSERLGVRNNPYELLKHTFEEGADLVLYLEEDLLLAPDATELAQWYVDNRRPEWMCLSLLSGGCGSKGFISDRAYPEILFAGKSFNSLGFAVRRAEWEQHLGPVWLRDRPMLTSAGREARGWDWSVYLHLITTPGLLTLQPAAARATHTGRYGVYCRPAFHDVAFGGLDLAEGLPEGAAYQVFPLEALPTPVRRQAFLWDQTNSALQFINEKMTLLRDHEDAYQLSVLWAFRMFLGRDPEPDEMSGYKAPRSRSELIATLRACEEFHSAYRRLSEPGAPKLPVHSMTNSREAVIWAYLLLLNRRPENEAVIDGHAKKATIGDLRRAMLLSHEFKKKFVNDVRET